jgi:hypothetical protein
MSKQDDHVASDTGKTPDRGLSRRRVLTGAGLAVAGGVAATATTSTAAGAADTTPSSAGRVAVGRKGSTAAEFRGRISQTGNSGETFTAYGYLIAADGAASTDLFAGSLKNETTALLTLYATGTLTNRVLDTAVHSLDISGSLDVYQRSAAGASFVDPSTFTVGTKVASFEMTLQDVLSVFLPGQGIPTLTGDMVQAFSGTLGGGLSGKKFGMAGLNLRMFATGLGTLVDPVTLNAQLEIAGNWATE